MADPVADLTQTVLDHVAEAILVVDAQGVVICTSPAGAAVCGGDPCGKPLKDFLDSAQSAQGGELARLLQAGAASEATFVFASARAASRPVLLQGLPTFKSGRPAGCVLKCIPSESSDGNRLRPSSVALNDEAFFMMLAHEIRSPLSALSSGTRLLTMATEQEERAWTLNMLNNQVRQMTGLVDDFLDLARLTSGTLPLERKPAVVAEVLDAALAAAADALEIRRQTAAVSNRDMALRVEGDAGRLCQAIEGMLRDASRTFDEGVALTVTISSEADQVAICIGGPDLDAGRFGGTGMLPQSALHIGVLLAQGICERHGGSLLANRAESGRGNQFLAKLPLAQG